MLTHPPRSLFSIDRIVLCDTLHEPYDCYHNQPNSLQKGIDMSKADELAESLKRQQQQKAEAYQAQKKAIDEWPNQVYEVYSTIEGWLAPLLNVGLKIKRIPTQVYEDAFSGERFSYSINKLQLEANNRTITFNPIARFILGASGRIDIELSNPETYLIRKPIQAAGEEWKIQRLPHSPKPRPDPEPFNEDNLLSVIQQGLKL